MKKSMFILVMLVLVASMVLPGCGSKTAAGGGEIAVIVKTGNSSFWQNVQTGAMAAQTELKAKTPKLSVTFLGAQSESNINEEINIVESAIDRGVKAIVLAPSDTKALQPAVKKAKDAGIPVIIIDSKLDGDPSQYVAFLATDNKAAGEACAKALIEGVQGRTGSDSRQNRRHVVRRRRRVRDRARGWIQGLHRRELETGNCYHPVLQRRHAHRAQPDHRRPARQPGPGRHFRRQ